MIYLTLKCQVKLKRHEKPHTMWVFTQEVCLALRRLLKARETPNLGRLEVSGRLGGID